MIDYFQMAAHNVLWALMIHNKEYIFLYKPNNMDCWMLPYIDKPLQMFEDPITELLEEFKKQTGFSKYEFREVKLISRFRYTSERDVVFFEIYDDLCVKKINKIKNNSYIISKDNNIIKEIESFGFVKKSALCKYCGDDLYKSIIDAFKFMDYMREDDN